MAALTVTVQAALGTPGLKFVADVAALAAADTVAVVTHGLNTLNPIVIQNPTASPNDITSLLKIDFTSGGVPDPNSFQVAKNTTGATVGSTGTWRLVVLRPHSLIAKPV